MQVYELDNGDMFMWQGQVYQVVDVSADPCICICRARQDTFGNLYPVSSHNENFNPYADVNRGSLQLIWSPHNV